MKQSTNIKHLVFLTFTLTTLFFVSCSKDGSEIELDPDNNEPDITNLTFAQVIAQGNDFDSFPQSRTTEEVAVSDPFPEDYETTDDSGETAEERFICTSRTVSVLDGNGQFPLFSPNSDVIYPASLLQGGTLGDATPAPIVVERAGGTISYNLNNGNTNSSFTVETVTKSSIQNAMNTIISNAGDILPANYQLDIIQVDSEEQLALEMGIDATTFSAQVSADMSFSTNNTYNRSLVKLTQQYYTMSFDLPTSLEAIFAPSVTPEQLDVFVQPDNPATFISSVTYGRIFYMLIETTSSRSEMDLKVNASYGAFNNSVSGELEVNALSSLNDLRIKVIAYGGNTSGSFSLAGLTDTNEIANLLESSTDIRAGLPLSYVVRSVERPDMIVGTTLATEYDVVECELRGILPPGRYADFVDIFDDGIGALVKLGNFNLVLFNGTGTEYVLYNPSIPGILESSPGEFAVFSIDDANAPLGALSIANVGAGIQRGSGTVELFDNTGFNMQTFISLGGSFPASLTEIPSAPLGTSSETLLVNEQLEDANYAFGSEGIEAGVRLGVNTFGYFGKPGEQYQLRQGNSFQNQVHDNENWFTQNPDADNPNENIEAMFNRVGATTQFGTGPSGRYIFINNDGDQMVEWNSFELVFKGPWVIN